MLLVFVDLTLFYVQNFVNLNFVKIKFQIEKHENLNFVKIKF